MIGDIPQKRGRNIYTTRSDRKGLTTSEVTKRQEKYGFNELKNKKKDPLGNFSLKHLKIRWLLF